LPIGTRYCQIGDPRRLEARLMIDQADAQFVYPGQNVKMIMAQAAGYVYVSQVESISPDEVKVSPTHLASTNKGDLPTQMTPSGESKPQNPVFDVKVPLPERDPHSLLRVGLVGRAKIRTDPRTLWDRFYTYLQRTI